jgi:hypothetical protein
MINQGWHSVVGVNAEKFVGKLVAFADVALNNVVIEPAFFKLNRYFFAVRGRPVM